MENHLPGFKKGFSAKRETSGFTLVELLIVVSIIAILAVMGFAAYRGLQPNARDARRKADINAIANALEANKDPVTGYTAVTGSQFSSSGVPVDPTATSTSDTTHAGCGSAVAPTNKCWYCLKNPGSYSAGWCDTSVYGSGNDSVDNSSDFTSSWGNNGWIVCANLESGSPTYYCRSNTQ